MINKKYRGIGVYLSTGNGFKAPLDAIMQNLDEQQFDLRALDFFSDLGIKRWDNFWKKTWAAVLKRPWLLRLSYYTQKRFLTKIYVLIHYYTEKKRLLSWIEHENPDFIISTHFVTTLIMPFLVKKSGKRIPVFAYNAEVVSAHASNVSAGVRAYFLPTEEGASKLIKCGQPAASVRTAPFPINKKFTRLQLTTEQAREKHELRKDLFTLLMSFGGDGIGSTLLIEQIAEKKLPVQIIAVCGKNKELYDKVSAIKAEHPDALIQLYGFVDNMPELVAASDLCTGKSGMNAVFEAIYMKKPYAATSALYNEEVTLRYLVKNGYGWDARDPGAQLRILNECLSSGSEYKKIKENLEQSDIDFGAEKYNDLITAELERYKKQQLKNSKALYFDMAGTLCDIPINSDNWDQINIDGINRTIDFLGFRDYLNKEQINQLIDHFIENKRKLRKQAKTTLQESAISGQLEDFMKYAEESFPDVKENRPLSSITENDMQTMDKLFVSTELDITIPFDGVVEMLEELAGKYDLYLLSNNVSRRLVLDIIDKIGCAHCFKDLFVSEDCGYRKPHINFLDYVTSITGLEPQDCVMIGDRLTQDIRLANLHNLKSIYAAMVDHEDNEGAESEYYDYIIHDFNKLKEIFL